MPERPQNTYYIRHWPPNRDFHQSRQAVQADLYKNRQIAIHYEDVHTADEQDYSTSAGRIGVRRFAKLARDGGYICAFYPAINKMLVGRIEPESGVEVWDYNDDFKCLKSLKMNNAKAVSDSLALRWNAIAPQGTMYRWQAIGNKVVRFVDGTEQERSWNWLTVAEQETVCAEYLRSDRVPKTLRLAHLLLPVGRTLKDVDIFGLTTERIELYGQVTLSSSREVIEQKMERLCVHTGQLVLFSPVAPMTNKVNWISTEEVWNWLRQNDSYCNALFRGLF